MRSFANFLEREAGYLIVSMLLLVVGAVFHKLQIPKADDLIIFSLGVMSRSMLGTSTTASAKKESE